MYESVTPSGLQAQMLESYSGVLATSEGSFLNDLTAAVAYVLWEYYDTLEALEDMAFVNADSGEYIDRRAAEYGVVRKAGTAAAVTLKFTGIAGAEIAAGTVFADAFGHDFETDEAAVIEKDETATVAATAREAGSAYNVPAGAITFFDTAIYGVSAVVNEAAAAGGTDTETDEQLYERLRLFRQTPAASGNAAAYKNWALEVSGIGDAKVFPLVSGPGTVGVRVVGPDKKPVLSSAVIAEAASHIDELRPIGAAVTVASAEAFTVNVSADITLSAATTASAAAAALEAALSDRFAQMAFREYTVKINEVGALIMDISGVTDYAQLTINGGTANLTVPDNAVPVLGTVTLT